MVIKTFYTKNEKEYTKNETVYTVYDYPYNVINWNYTTVRKQEMTNSNLDKDLFDEVIISGRVEIEV